MLLKEFRDGVKALDSIRATGIHTRMAILLLTVYEEEGLKQSDYCERLNWKIQIVNRYALNMEREGLVDLIPLDSDPRGRARAIILKFDIRERITQILRGE